MIFNADATHHGSRRLRAHCTAGDIYVSHCQYAEGPAICAQTPFLCGLSGGRCCTAPDVQGANPSIVDTGSTQVKHPIWLMRWADVLLPT